MDRAGLEQHRKIKHGAPIGAPRTWVHAAAAPADAAAASWHDATPRSHAPVVDLDDDLDEPMPSCMPGAPFAAAPRATHGATPPPSSMQISSSGEASAALHIEEVD